MRSNILSQLHIGHFGIEKTRQRARSTVYWPGLSKEIETLINSCQQCQSHQKVNQKEPMIPHPIPVGPWQSISADLFQLEGKEYIVAVHRYSLFMEYKQLPNTSSHIVIKFFLSIFSRWGIPMQVCTDNGTQFTSQEFQEFAASWNFKHVTSSPFYPRSNGLAEKGVGIIKNILKKAQDVHLAILEYHSTPVLEHFSPAQLMMNRNVRSVLPVTDKYLSTKPCPPCW